MTMRPFNPYTEDIDMYLEEAKEKGLIIPNQKSLRQWAARVNAQNEEIVKRDEKARQDQTLKKNLERDKKIAEERTERERRKQARLDYEQYVKRFDKRHHRGQYDSNNSIKNVTQSNLAPATYTGWKPRIWSTDGVEVQPQFKNNQFKMSNFDIVVDTESKTHFVSNFPKLNSTWIDSSQSNDITQVKFDINDPYFSSLANAYKVFCLTGFSLQHLNSTDPFVKSLSNYFVY